jgi:hypothetical protein
LFSIYAQQLQRQKVHSDDCFLQHVFCHISRRICQFLEVTDRLLYWHNLLITEKSTSCVPCSHDNPHNLVYWVVWLLCNFCVLLNQVIINQPSRGSSLNRPLTCHSFTCNFLTVVRTHALSIGYNGNYIQESVNTKFLGLQIDNHLNWTNRINKLIPKLRGACYAVRSMLHVSNTDTLR